MNKRVLFSGFSGSGKTTLAKAIGEELQIPFISGSIYDLMPEIDKNQEALNKKTPSEIYQRNLRILSLRQKQYRNTEGSFITDRSIFDTVGYSILNGYQDLGSCDLDSITEMCNLTLSTLPPSRRITHLIYIPFERDTFFNWEIENNQKRITNPYYQRNVSQNISFALELQGINFSWFQKHFSKNPKGEISIHHSFNEEKELYPIQLLVLRELDYHKRIKIIKSFLK